MPTAEVLAFQLPASEQTRAAETMVAVQAPAQAEPRMQAELPVQAMLEPAPTPDQVAAEVAAQVDAARAAEARGDWPVALAAWSAAAKAEPAHAAAARGRIVALQRLDRQEDAEEALRDAVRHFPQDPWFPTTFARMAQDRRDWPAALERWEAMRVAIPEVAGGYACGSWAMLELGKLDAAEALLAEAVARFPRDRSVRHAWAHAASRRKDWAAALKRWATIRETFPDFAPGYAAGTWTLLALGELDAAEALATEAVARFPRECGVHHAWAQTASRRKDWAAAVNRWATMREVFPSFAPGYAAGSWALLEAGRAEEAEAILAEGVTRFPEDRGILQIRAQIAARQGHWAMALERWGALRAVASDILLAEIGTVDALIGLQRLDEADAFLEAALQRHPGERALLTLQAKLAGQRDDAPAEMAVWGR